VNTFDPVKYQSRIYSPGAMTDILHYSIYLIFLKCQAESLKFLLLIYSYFNFETGGDGGFGMRDLGLAVSS